MEGLGSVERQPREDAALVLSELLSNAIRHGRALETGQVRAAWKLRNGHIEIAVTDGGALTTPRVVDASEYATAGRGLFIVDQLATSWWQTTDGAFSTVYALLRL
jgi:anti-sigma regulatory factor (Ser/Thr protein kinase)